MCSVRNIPGAPPFLKSKAIIEFITFTHAVLKRVGNIPEKVSKGHDSQIESMNEILCHFRFMDRANKGMGFIIAIFSHIQTLSTKL